MHSQRRSVIRIDTMILRPQLVLAAAVSMALGACGGGKKADPKAEIASGVDLSLRYSFDVAEEHFARARAASEPGSEAWLEATLGLAVSLHHKVPLSARRTNEQAAPLYEEVFAKGGRSLLGARAALNRGRIAEERDEKDDPIDATTAAIWYGKVIDGWPDDPVAGEATLRAAACHIQTLDPAQVRRGIALAEARAAARPAELWAGSLWQLAGDTWWTVLFNRSESIRCLLKAQEAGLPDPSRAWITAWRIASLAEDDARPEIAIAQYRTVITKYPASGKGWEAQQRLIALGVTPPPMRPPLDLGTEAAR
jgi:hypothetical protein